MTPNGRDARIGNIAAVSSTSLASYAVAACLRESGFGPIETGLDPLVDKLIAEVTVECAVVDITRDPTPVADACAELARRGLGEPPLILLLTGEGRSARPALSSMLARQPIGVLGPCTITGEIVQVVRKVLTGNVLYMIDRDTRSHLRAMRARLRDVDQQAVGLSSEDSEYLRLVARGFADRRIADHLYVSEATVRRRVLALRRRIGVANRCELAAWAGENGFYKGEDRPALALIPKQTR